MPTPTAWPFIAQIVGLVQRTTERPAVPPPSRQVLLFTGLEANTLLLVLDIMDAEEWYVLVSSMYPTYDPMITLLSRLPAHRHISRSDTSFSPKRFLSTTAEISPIDENRLTEPVEQTISGR
jgi:hypothetical protein